MGSLCQFGVVWRFQVVKATPPQFTMKKNKHKDVFNLISIAIGILIMFVSIAVFSITIPLNITLIIPIILFLVGIFLTLTGGLKLWGR